MKFSETLRNYRKEKGWTLEYLSGATKLSIAQLSKLETGKSSPSVDSLRRLAAVYGVSISALTHSDEMEPLSPVRRGDGFVMHLQPNKGKAHICYLTIKRTAKMQPAVLTIEPGGNAAFPRTTYPCDEFFYVTEGSVDFFYGDNEPCTMDKGDFLYYNGIVPHKWENKGESDAVLLISVDPPVM